MRQAGAGAKSDTKLEQKGASIPHRTTQSSAIEKAQLADEPYPYPYPYPYP